MPAPHAVRIQPPDLSGWRYGGMETPWVHQRGSGLAGPEVLITALIHGNEYSGALALEAFLASGLLPKRGRITAAFCNVAAFSRFDPSVPDASRFVDEDMNRVWHPERLDGPSDSQELRRARELRPFVERSTHLLDLHSMHEDCGPLLVTGTLARNIAFAQGLLCSGQIVIDEGHQDGVRMRDFEGGAAGDERIALLLEAGQHWDPASVTHARNVHARFLIEAGAMERGDFPQGWLLPDAKPPLPVRVTQAVVARTQDLYFLGTFSGGEVIREAGTPIAMDGGEPVVTPYDDCVLVMPSIRQLRPGVTVVRLGQRVPQQEAVSSSAGAVPHSG